MSDLDQFREFEAQLLGHLRRLQGQHLTNSSGNRSSPVLAWMQAIERALERISDGTYGRCVDCRTALPLERLKRTPELARCSPCSTAFLRGDDPPPH